jgi:type VI secretion system FHA domain protein
LSDGDRLGIGDYSVLVKVEPQFSMPAEAPPSPRYEPTLDADDLLGPRDNPAVSIRPIGERQQAFGIDLGGAPASDLRDDLGHAGADHTPILSSGTQRDELHAVFEPLPDAKGYVDPASGSTNESSLLEGLEGSSSPRSSSSPMTPSPFASVPSANGVPIPDNYDPFAPGTLHGSPRPTPAVADGMRAPNAPGPIPDSFDPFSPPTAPPSRAAPVTGFVPETSPDRAPRPAPRPSAAAPSNTARPADQRGGDFSLLEGLEGESVAPEQPPRAQPAPAVPPSANKPSVASRTTPTAEPARKSAASSQAAEPQSREAGYNRALDELLGGAGVAELAEQVRATRDPLRRAGELLRMMVVGLQRVLMARALTKQELHVDMTIVARRDVCPLRFLADPNDALKHLLAPRADGVYLPPDRAVVEAFEDVQAHHLAVMAGMRAALHGVLRRFDPEQLERRLESHPLLDKLIPMHRKAKMWDLLSELHKDIESESDDEFDRLFGEAFRKAYEEQVRQLRGIRKKDSAKPS